MMDSTSYGCMTLDELIRRIRKFHPEDDMELVRRAYAFAEHAHANQKSKSGEPYVCHPCAVAVILTDLMERQMAVEGTLEMANLVDGVAVIKESVA